MSQNTPVSPIFLSDDEDLDLGEGIDYDRLFKIADEAIQQQNERKERKSCSKMSKKNAPSKGVLPSRFENDEFLKEIIIESSKPKENMFPSFVSPTKYSVYDLDDSTPFVKPRKIETKEEESKEESGRVSRVSGGSPNNDENGHQRMFKSLGNSVLRRRQQRLRELIQEELASAPDPDYNPLVERVHGVTPKRPKLDIEEQTEEDLHTPSRGLRNRARVDYSDLDREGMAISSTSSSSETEDDDTPLEDLVLRFKLVKKGETEDDDEYLVLSHCSTSRSEESVRESELKSSAKKIQVKKEASEASSPVRKLNDSTPLRRSSRKSRRSRTALLKDIKEEVEDDEGEPETAAPPGLTMREENHSRVTASTPSRRATVKKFESPADSIDTSEFGIFSDDENDWNENKTPYCTKLAGRTPRSRKARSARKFASSEKKAPFYLDESSEDEEQKPVAELSERKLSLRPRRKENEQSARRSIKRRLYADGDDARRKVLRSRND